MLVFVHILIKYTLIFGYIANHLTTIDDINLPFPQKKKKKKKKKKVIPNIYHAL